MTTYSESYEEETEEQSDETSMSFLDHLDELRSRLIRSAIFVLVAFLVCWGLSDHIYHFLEVPVRAAMLQAKKIIASGVTAETLRLVDYPDGALVTFTFLGDAKVGEALIPAGATLTLKVQRAQDGVPELVTVTPHAMNQANVIPEGTVLPRELYDEGNAYLGPDNKLIVGTVQGAFNLYIKVAFYAAIFFAVPFLLVQAWGFISPGLYPHEKKYAAPFIIMASVFFIAGCAFAYYIAFPRAANFLLGVAAEGNLRPLVSADEYFDLILTITLGLGAVFEIPTVTFFLSRLGLVTPKLLVKFWKIAVLVIFVVAALLSPTTDIPNLLVFAAPMLLLYGLSIGIAYVFHRKRQAEA
jgi:sec-independent protein translocase protein TatC